MTAIGHADEPTAAAGEQPSTGRRRPRDRGFQRPGGPALVARPEPLAAVPAPPAPAPEPAPVPAPAESVAVEPDDTADRLTSTAPAAPKPPPQTRGRGTNLPMPPSRHTELRVQFNTKLRPASIARTKAFADHHQASIQDVVELALDEFLSRRGWPAPEGS
jgi:hypothetical protein